MHFDQSNVHKTNSFEICELVNIFTSVQSNFLSISLKFDSHISILFALCQTEVSLINYYRRFVEHKFTRKLDIEKKIFSECLETFVINPRFTELVLFFLFFPPG